ncbi:MAG: hemerythrin domain-containing protein [Gammaproteobacteria bacterium]
MPAITARTTIRELQAGPPALMQVLRSAGLYRDGDDPDSMLGQLCWTIGFNPGILLMMLQSAPGPAGPPPLDIRPWLDVPLPEFVAHIEEVYHAGLRRQLPRLLVLTAAAATAAPDDERLAALRTEVAQLAGELAAHLAHEEEALFPMIRGLADGTVVATRCGSAVGGPIACMENDHAQAERGLLRLRELTDGYSTPAAADELRALLREFDQELREHMYKENEALFPRALAAQQAASGASQSHTAPRLTPTGAQP